MGRRVLVVDDSATLRTILRSVLEGAGYLVETAADGAEALERAQRGRFDLLILDFVMPRLNGYQVAQAMRAIPTLQRLPVVLVSAKAEQIGERFVAQTNALGVLQKPFTPAALLDLVERAFARVADDDPLAGLGVDLDDTSTNKRDGVDQRFHDARTVAIHGLGPAVVAAAAALRARASEPASAVHPRPASSPVPAPAVRSSAPPPLPTPPPAAPTEPPAARAPSQVVLESAHARFTELLARDLTPAFQDTVGARGAVTEDTVLGLLRFYLSTARVAALFHELRPLDEGLRGNAVLDGMLDAVPLGEVFQLLALQSQTGLLVVERSAEDGDALVSFALRQGRIDLALSRGLGGEFRIGRYLIDAGVVSRSHVDAVVEGIAEQRILLGQALVTGGFIREDDLERALVRQTCELAYEVLRWERGRFRFEVGSTLPEAQHAQLDLSSDAVALEGYRRLDEWRMMNEYLPSAGVVFVRQESGVAALPRDEFHRDEQRVLDAIDGRRTVGDLVEHVHMSTFDACKILYRLLHARLVTPVAA